MCVSERERERQTDRERERQTETKRNRKREAKEKEHARDSARKARGDVFFLLQHTLVPHHLL